MENTVMTHRFGVIFFSDIDNIGINLYYYCIGEE